MNKDWEADVRAFDEVYEHILHMADALSDGIVKQFANKFAESRSDPYMESKAKLLGHPIHPTSRR